MFADDTTLIAHSLKDNQEITTLFAEAAKSLHAQHQSSSPTTQTEFGWCLGTSGLESGYTVNSALWGEVLDDI